MILLQRGNVLRSFIMSFRGSRDYISNVYESSVLLKTLTFVFAHCSELLKVAGASGDNPSPVSLYKARSAKVDCPRPCLVVF